jgi:hypothetical protein
MLRPALFGLRAWPLSGTLAASPAAMVAALGVGIGLGVVAVMRIREGLAARRRLAELRRAAAGRLDRFADAHRADMAAASRGNEEAIVRTPVAGVLESLRSGRWSAAQVVAAYVGAAESAHAKTNCITEFFDDCFERAAKVGRGVVVRQLFVPVSCDDVAAMGDRSDGDQVIVR